MREIKYRAWHKEANRMFFSSEIESSLTSPSGDGEYFMPAGFILDGHKAKNFVELRDDGETVLERQLEIMQYTGLKDKNGQDIYEGDVLRAKRKTSSDHPVLTYVTCRWNAKSARFVFVSERVYQMDRRLSAGEVTRLGEVIGNIYENADLLEAKQ